MLTYNYKLQNAMHKIKTLKRLEDMYVSIKFSKPSPEMTNENNRIHKIIRLDNNLLKQKNEFARFIKKESFKIKKVPEIPPSKILQIFSHQLIYDIPHIMDCTIDITGRHKGYKIQSFIQEIERTNWKNTKSKTKNYVSSYSDRSYFLRSKNKKIKINSFSYQFIDRKHLNNKKETTKLKSKAIG